MNSSHVIMADNDEDDGFEVSDFFELSEFIEEDDDPPSPFLPVDSVTFPHPAGAMSNPNYATYSHEVMSDQLVSSSNISSSVMHERSFSGERGKEKKEVQEKVAFKTKSEVEVLNDGFKWRKYGKKMVKNSPNPRNYFKCSIEGCPAKKRVERDRDDPRYVVTTYVGVHNHIGTQP